MTFESEVAKFKDIAKDEVLRVKRAASVELFNGVIRDTPFDEGTLRANWQASIGNPNTATVDAQDKSGAKTQSDAEIVAFGAKLGDNVYLANYLPYAYRVEFEGHSKVKAPQGMMRINIQRVAKNLKKFIRR